MTALDMIVCQRLGARLTAAACFRRQCSDVAMRPPGPCGDCEHGRAVAAELGQTITPKLSRCKAAGLRGSENSKLRIRKGRQDGQSPWSPQWTGR